MKKILLLPRDRNLNFFSLAIELVILPKDRNIVDLINSWDNMFNAFRCQINEIEMSFGFTLDRKFIT
jgi:hypothetical protein